MELMHHGFHDYAHFADYIQQVGTDLTSSYIRLVTEPYMQSWHTTISNKPATNQTSSYILPLEPLNLPPPLPPYTYHS